MVETRWNQTKPNQMLCNILVRFSLSAYITWLKQFRPRFIPAVLCSIVVVCTLTCCAMLPSVCALKAAHTNVQLNLIRELRLYVFETGHNNVKATKTIYWAKRDNAVDQSAVTRWLNKVHSSCKNFDNQTRSGRLKTLGFKNVLQAVVANSASQSPAWFVTFRPSGVV